MIKILKNNTNEDVIISDIGQIIKPLESFTIIPEEYNKYANSQDVFDLIDNETLTVNNGERDMSPFVGKEHLSFGVLWVHQDMTIIPGVGEEAPELVSVSNIGVGYSLAEGISIFAQTRIDNIIGDKLELEGHLYVDSEEIDKAVYARLTYHITDGKTSAKLFTDTHSVVTLGPVIINPILNAPFTMHFDINSNEFSNNERYLLMKLDIPPMPSGYTRRTNPIILWRVCKEHWKRVV